jgi:hypothetical protein
MGFWIDLSIAVWSLEIRKRLDAMNTEMEKISNGANDEMAQAVAFRSECVVSFLNWLMSLTLCRQMWQSYQSYRCGRPGDRRSDYCIGQYQRYVFLRTLANLLLIILGAFSALANGMDDIATKLDQIKGYVVNGNSSRRVIAFRRLREGSERWSQVCQLGLGY